MKTLLLIASALTAQVGLAVHCLVDAQHSHAEVEYSIGSRIEELMMSRDHRHYRAALTQLEQEYAQVAERASVFGDQQFVAIEGMNQRFSELVNSIEDQSLDVAWVGRKTGHIFRDTFQEMGVTVFNLEDHADTMYAWRRMMALKGVKLAQTDQTHLATFWLNHMDREKTFLFFDGKIHDDFVGPSLAARARELNYRNVFMVSAEMDDDLAKGGKPADVPNFIKPVPIGQIVRLIQGQQ